MDTRFTCRSVQATRKNIFGSANMFHNPYIHKMFKVRLKVCS